MDIPARNNNCRGAAPRYVYLNVYNIDLGSWNICISVIAKNSIPIELCAVICSVVTADREPPNQRYRRCRRNHRMAGVCPLRASVTYAIPRNTRGLTKRANWDVEPGQLRVMHPAALIDRHGADARAIAGQDFPEQGASHRCRDGRSAWQLSARHAARTENRLPPNEHAVFIGGIADRLPARVRSGEDLYVFVATVFVHLFDAPIARRDPVLENLGP